MLEFIICDDKKNHNNYFKNAIEKVLEKRKLDGTIACVTEHPDEVLNYSFKNKGKPNVYVLDIDFSGTVNGLELAKKIRENEPAAYIIFASAHLEYAMQCFKVKTFDFLIKPLNLTTIERCIVNLFEDYERTQKINRQIIPVKSGSNIHLVTVRDVYYIEKFNNVAVFHTKNGIIRTYESLDKIQEQLEDHGFYRCHKSYLVNLSEIDYFSIGQNYLYMKNKKKVLVSRNYKKELIKIVECRL